MTYFSVASVKTHNLLYRSITRKGTTNSIEQIKFPNLSLCIMYHPR